MELNKIYNEDCLVGMKKIPDASVDCVICDLPYGTTVCKWDSIIPFKPLWEQYLRIAKKNAAFVLFAGEPFTSRLIMSNIKLFRQKLTWLKTRPTNVMNAKKQFMNWTEDICIFYRKLPVFNPQMRTDGQFTGKKIQHLNESRKKGVHNGYQEKEGYIHESNGGLFYPKTVLEYSNVHQNQDDHFHPTQKPVALIQYLIRTYTNEGDLVLDNCSGSGTTAISCIKEKRNFICFEKDETYWKKSVERVENEQQQLTLF